MFRRKGWCSGDKEAGSWREAKRAGFKGQYGRHWLPALDKTDNGIATPTSDPCNWCLFPYCFLIIYMVSGKERWRAGSEGHSWVHHSVKGFTQRQSCYCRSPTVSTSHLPSLSHKHKITIEVMYYCSNHLTRHTLLLISRIHLPSFHAVLPRPISLVTATWEK